MASTACMALHPNIFNCVLSTSVVTLFWPSPGANPAAYVSPELLPRHQCAFLPAGAGAAAAHEAAAGSTRRTRCARQEPNPCSGACTPHNTYIVAIQQCMQIDSLFVSVMQWVMSMGLALYVQKKARDHLPSAVPRLFMRAKY